MTPSANPEWDYLHGQMRPEHPALLAAFARESEASLACRPVLDLPYGAHERETFDFFAGNLYSGGAPWRATLLYLHAGYWQSRDKAQFRFLAPPFLAAGIDVALMNYPLCPDVGVRQIVESVLRGAPAVLAEAARRQRGGERLIACGHSAGAHLSVELALARPALVEQVVAVSGVYDLAPLLETALNDKLRLDAAEAVAASPLHRIVAPKMPALFVVGAGETPAFRAQSAAMHTAWPGSTLIEVPGADHFSVLRSLGPQLLS